LIFPFAVIALLSRPRAPRVTTHTGQRSKPWAWPRGD
jgi:hypothetical protein